MSRDPVTSTYSRFLTGARTGEDGLTYKESVHRAVSSDFWGTISAAGRTPRAVAWRTLADERADGEGAHSLRFLARRVINQNLQHLGLDALMATPWEPLGRCVWEDVIATRQDSLILWQLFATAYGPLPALQTRTYTLPASERLQPLINALVSPSHSWLVKLRLRLQIPSDDGGDGGLDVSVLPALQNLKALHITGAVGVDDGVVRAWGRAAVHDRRFDRLQVMSLRGFVGVTENVLAYAAWIPSLRWLDLTACHWSVANTGGRWVQVGVEEWEEGRKREKERERDGEITPVVKVRMGGYKKPGKKNMSYQEMRFVRVEEPAGERKRKAPSTAEKKPVQKPVMRQKRLKNMGDLLAEFQNPPPRGRGRGR